jgi:hypothetical protein
MKRTAILLTVLCFFAVTFAHLAVAQQKSGPVEKAFNVAGNWDVTVRMPTGKVMEKWTIKQVGDKITATSKGPDGADMPVTGEIVTRIFFRVSQKASDTERLIRATINDNNSMDGSVTIGTAEHLWSATRSK